MKVLTKFLEIIYS